jgi:asparaginyl-tRNA synthetase
MDLVQYKQKHTNICCISVKNAGQTLLVNGWVRNTRVQASVGFVELFDGSTSKTIQLISESKEIIELMGSLSIGSSLSVSGLVVMHPVKSDVVEIKISTVHYAGVVKDPVTYILNAKKTSLEQFRLNQDVRVKSRTFNAAFRIRSGLSKATHDFWHMLGFHHLNPNMVTTSDCEGGGEVFTLTNMLGANVDDIPLLEKSRLIDYSKDFFQQQAFLTVSSQLQLEMLCAGLGKVWTSNKSFRSEKSRTSRHLAEFEHIEWETAWCSLEDLMDQSEQYTQYCFNYVLSYHRDDLDELNKFVSKGIIEKLEGFVKKRYVRITYDEALDLINLHKDKLVGVELPKWGDDLGSECEKFIADVIYNGPVFVYNYPASLKSFYMKANDDGRTVQGCDLLIPGLGELVGSSVREHDYGKLMTVVEKRGMDASKLAWYLDLRKNGSTPTAGAGLGFDRLVRICTGLENIRDAVPFPVAYQECKF